MDAVFLIGRILFALMFLMSGLRLHLAQVTEATEYAKAAPNRPPAPEVLVPLSGVAIVLGALSVALGVWGDLGALLIIGFLIGITPFMHAFWRIQDPQESANQMAHFSKNVTMLGSAVILFWVFNQLQDPPLTVTDALFGRI
jgi:uncharacterized membrane protein YphA (DoxX/SURF4 family)